MVPSQTIALVGMPGSGKSTIGRGLAQRLRLSFVDSDKRIEERIGGTIRDFFEREGEAAFRELEHAVLAEILRDPQPLVLATGGGSVLRDDNRQLLRTHACVLYLRSSPEELYRRLRRDTRRPLLQVDDPQAKLRELYATRDPLYRDCARFTVDTGRPSVATLVSMVVSQLELAGVLPRG